MSGSGFAGRMGAAAIVAFVAAGAGLSATAAASSPSSRTCPSASEVNTDLGVHVKAPTSKTTTYSKTCSYGGSVVPTMVTFQVDTAASFAAGENAVEKAEGVVKIKGLGQAAWATKAGGSLYVYDNGQTVKIISILVPTAKLEVLARKLI